MLAALGMTRDIRKGEVFSYLFMPQIAPRIRALYQSGFSHLAYMIALVYRAVNILPQDHAILTPARRHNLGLREVLGAAAAELEFNRKNIDKILIYFIILFGLVMLCLQFFMTLGFMMTSPAFAGAGTMPTNYAQFFATPAYNTDVAYRMLFSVFGVPDLFNTGGTRTPYHIALHSLFQLYSVGLLVIAVIIACYFIFAIVVETAQTGVPFGKRYNHVWTPIRLVFALGLLIPVGYGLNSAQWITLYAAKFGSDFATRGWIIFNEKMTEAYLRNPSERVGRPQTPELMKLAGFMMTVNACKFAYESLYTGADKKTILAYFVKSTSEGGSLQLSQTNYTQAKNFFNNGDILIRFGEQDTEKFNTHLGNVFPYCGDIVIPAGDNEPGTIQMKDAYLNLVREMFASDYQQLRTHGENFIKKFINDPNIRDPNAALPPPQYKAATAEALRTRIDTVINTATTAQGDSPTWNKNAADIQALGWGGAGMWYNKIAQINGSFVTAVNGVPDARRMPEILEYIKRKQLQQNVKVPVVAGTNLADGMEMKFSSTLEQSIGTALTEVQAYWTREDVNQSTMGNQTKTTNNVLIDAINLVFGTRGLFDMCANSTVHPLAQLSILGKGLVEASIRNLGLAAGFAIPEMLQIPFLGAAAGAASSILLSVASITITMGFILYYVLPFMPFLYFFFAVGGWIKGLFEAMVGVPLWALAHLRIDGEGLPGDAANDGYYLIFEIFLRPILIVFGLLASVVIFAAMVKILNEIYSLVVVNLAGHDEGFTQLCDTVGGAGPSGSAVAFFRGPVDELFFTIIYAIIVYMIGMSCFKLIDLVPNNILRYMGARVQTFNDTASDPAEGLMLRLSLGSQSVTGQLKGIAQGASGTASGAVQAGLNFANPQPKP